MAHVPKFGDWDSENVPYTAYFENARKDKISGARMINPNDPEQNPEAFMSMAGAMNHENETRSKHCVENPNLPRSRHAIRGRGKPDKEDLRGAEQRPKKQINGEEDAFDEDIEVPPHRFRSAGSSDSQSSRNQKSRKSESVSDRSNSDHALLKSNRRAERSGQSRTSAEGSSSFTPPVEQARLKGGNARVDRIPQKAASVPKFGSWDETDPRSGEGFTVIFNKVKEEKQIGASRLPTIPAETSFNSSNGHKNHGNSKSSLKRCCGLF